MNEESGPDDAEDIKKPNNRLRDKITIEHQYVMVFIASTGKKFLSEKDCLRYEKRLEKQKRYYQKNKDRIQQKLKSEIEKDIDAHREKIRLRQKKYRQENRQKYLESRRRYYRENKEKLKRRANKYYHTNKLTISEKRKNAYWDKHIK
jgi:hypothetical protein